MSATTREEWLESFGVSGWVHDDGTACPEYLAPPASTPPGGYWCTTHQMFVRHPDSPQAALGSREWAAPAPEAAGTETTDA